MNSWRISCTRLRKHPAAAGVLLAALTLVLAVLSLCIGAVEVTPAQVVQAFFTNDPAEVSARVVLYSRLPRTCGSLLAGAALAVSGVIIQTVLGNPLAAPHIIGVNAGAGFAVTVSCAIAPMAAVRPLAAFAGAMAGVLLVLVFAETTGASRITLVLAGVALSSMFSAGVDAVVTLYPDALIGYSDFRIGGMANLYMGKLLPAGAVILVSILLSLLLASEMDLLALGTDTAQSLGLRVRPVRVILLALAAALAGAAVSFAGLLGFVGLIVPHMVRRMLGGGSLRLVAGCALCGAALLTFCDLVSRLAFAPFELPVGIVLSLAGGPFFLWLLFQKKGAHL